METIKTYLKEREAVLKNEFYKDGGIYEKNEPFDCWEAFDGIIKDVTKFNQETIRTVLKMVREMIEEDRPVEKYTGFGEWSPKGMHIDDHKRMWTDKLLDDLKVLEDNINSVVK